MQTLEFKIQIDATANDVWKNLWEQNNYKKWTDVFCEGSYYKTDSFTQGNKIHLLTPQGDGMYSILDQIIVAQKLVFRHIGELKNFEEQSIDNAAEKWTNALESYELIPNENGIELIVKVDTIEEYINFMNKSFPLALQELKKMVENK